MVVKRMLFVFTMFVSVSLIANGPESTDANQYQHVSQQLWNDAEAAEGAGFVWPQDPESKETVCLVSTVACLGASFVGATVCFILGSCGHK